MDALNNARLPPPIPPRSPLRDAVYMDRAISLMAPLSTQHSSDSCAITFCSSTDESSDSAKSLRSRPPSSPWSGHYDTCNQSIRSQASVSSKPNATAIDNTSHSHVREFKDYHEIVESLRDAYMSTRPSTPTTPSATSGASTPTSPASSFTSADEPDWFSPTLIEKPKSLRPARLELLTKDISTDAMFAMIDQLPRTPSSKARDFSWYDVSVVPESPSRSSICRPYSVFPTQSPAASRLSLLDVPGRTSSLKRSKRRSRV